MSNMMSDYLREYVLEHVFTGDTKVAPAALYLAAFTTNPTEEDMGTEVAGLGYARQSIAFNVSAGVATNTSSITFPTATGDWGTVTHWGIYDSLTGGNLLVYGSFDLPRDIDSGKELYVAAGGINVSAEV